MRVPVKLLSFAVWLFSFDGGRCEDCLSEKIDYENIDPIPKASYTDGETVRVTCQLGYAGMYKLTCENGKWTEIIKRQCAKKKCSHPGDTPNGDFKLVEGTEFVFGATVLYTCKKGFEMTSLINQRTCRAQGWDNTVPTCEAMKCPPIRTDKNVIASGNTEEGIYSDVINFQCSSKEEMINGSRNIYCKETGDWSDHVPTCIPITCSAPNIPNGIIDDPKEEYPKDATLKYTCSKGYKPREGTPKCAKFGWTLNPECDAITCELKSQYGVKRIEPEGKTIFRPGESVEITCTEKHWFYGTTDISKSFTCRDDGKWDSEPICQEIRCEVPYNQHVEDLRNFNRADKKLGAQINYKCERGYIKKRKDEKATCTRNGWTPNPLCAEILCEAPDIPNAKIVSGQKSNYKPSSRLQYKCDDGFKPEELTVITCDFQGQWTKIQECTAKQKSCPDLSLENGFMTSQSSTKKEIFYSCKPGYKPFSGNWWDSVTCSEGSWSHEPRCITARECGALPSLQNGKLKQRKQTIQGEETAEVECDPGFTATQSLIKCMKGTWETPTCDGRADCGIPQYVANAYITSKPAKFYIDGSSVTYECQRPLEMNGKSTVFCRNGNWEQTPTCEGKCPKPLENFMTLTNNKPLYNNNESARYKCLEPYNVIPGGQWTCENGKWSGKFVCTSEICPPPPYVENGDYVPNKSVGKVITEVSYKCYSFYALNEPHRYYKCANGKWETPPKCLQPCAITEEIVKAYNLTPQLQTYYIKHGENHDHYCKWGFIGSTGHSFVSLKCSDGKLLNEPCQENI